jgi:hypothetical protein
MSKSFVLTNGSSHAEKMIIFFVALIMSHSLGEDESLFDSNTRSKKLSLRRTIAFCLPLPWIDATVLSLLYSSQRKYFTVASINNGLPMSIDCQSSLFS